MGLNSRYLSILSKSWWIWYSSVWATASEFLLYRHKTRLKPSVTSDKPILSGRFFKSQNHGFIIVWYNLFLAQTEALYISNLATFGVLAFPFYPFSSSPLDYSIRPMQWGNIDMSWKQNYNCMKQVRPGTWVSSVMWYLSHLFVSCVSCVRCFQLHWYWGSDPEWMLLHCTGAWAM